MWQTSETKPQCRSRREDWGWLVILTAVLTGLVLKHVSLHNQLSPQVTDEKSSGWQQPESVSANFPVPIGLEGWTFDYGRMATIVRGMKTLPSGDLILNGDTEKRLALFTAALPSNLSHAERERLAFLISKSAPGRAGIEFGQLIESYVVYEQALSRIEAEFKSDLHSSDLPSLEFSQHRNQLQVDIFGPISADKLFRRKNLTADYILARRRVSSDHALNVKRKQTLLKQLETAYLAALASLKVSN